MKLNELLAVCREQVNAEVEVMISGEGIVGSPAMLEGYLCKSALNMYVTGVVAMSKDKLRVWVGCDE